MIRARLFFLGLFFPAAVCVAAADARAQTSPSPSITGEFLWGGGLYQIGAHVAYDRGITGQGVKLAVLDTGVNYFHPELFPRIASGGFDFYDSDFDYMDYNGHGSLVSGIIAARKNDYGIHGVAYNSKVIPIKVTNDDGSFVTPGALKWGLYHAIQENAAAVNYSGTYATGNGFLLDNFAVEAGDAFAYTALGGMIVVASAGNGGSANPIFPALLPYVKPENHNKGVYFLAPGLSRNPAALDWSYSRAHILAVAAADQNGVISDFSNRCGVAASWCITAPGEDIISTFWYDTFIDMDGTSLSAPFVTGAIGLLKEMFPNLTSAQLVELILSTANKQGIYANQSIYGQGFLDIAKAVSPQGALRVVGGSGEASAVTLNGSALSGGGAFGDSLSASLQSQNLVIEDTFSRPYTVALDGVASMPEIFGASLREDIDTVRRAAEYQTVSFGEGLSFSAPLDRRESLIDEPRDEESEAAFADGALNWETGTYALSLRSGFAARGDMEENAAPMDALRRELFRPAYLDMAADGRAVGGRYALSSNTTFAMGWREGASLYDDTLDASAVTAGLELRSGAGDSAGRIGLSAGQVTEEDSTLGMTSSGAFALQSGSVTRFAGAEASWPVARDGRTRLVASFYAGETSASGDASGLVSDVSPIHHRQAALGIEQGGLWREGDRLTLAFESPLHVTSGRMRLDALNANDPGAGGLDIDLAPQGVERTLHLFYDAPMQGADGDFGVHLSLGDDTGNVSGARDASVLLHARLKF